MYPEYRIKIIYKCSLCGEEHVATSLARGKGLMAEILGSVPASQSVMKKCREQAKESLVEKFLQVHPSANSDDFDETKVYGEEITILGEGADNVNKDKIGIPWKKDELQSMFEKIKSSKKRKKEKKEKSALDTFALSDFENLEAIDSESIIALMRSKLETLERKERELSEELDTVVREKEKFLSMLKALENKSECLEDL